MTDFVMPSLGADMEEGTLVEWMVKPGDVVNRGDVIAVIETTKGAIETEIFETGTVGELLVAVGETVPVGTVLASIINADSEPKAKAGKTTDASAEAEHVERGVKSTTRLRSAERVAEESVPRPAAKPLGNRVRASPAARKRAAELGLMLTDIKGSGPAGAVTLSDVEAVLRKPKAGQARASTQRGFNPELMRQGIAAAMAQSKQEIPHYYLSTQIDMRCAQRWLGEENARRKIGDRLLQVVLPLKAMAMALRKVPELNGFYRDGEFIEEERIHVGMAIALRGGGLVAPALHDVDRKTLDELMQDLNDLIVRARTGRLRSSEMSDPTVTLTSLGDTGVEGIFGIIYPPQVAILGLGRVVERPWAVNGKIEACPVMQASLSADHRVSDGHRGAIFLNTLDKLLQAPEAL